MDVVLKDQEIKDALKNYVGHLGVNMVGKKVSVDITAGRGPSGYTASVSVTEGEEAPVKNTRKKNLEEVGDQPELDLTAGYNTSDPVATSESEPSDLSSIFGSSNNA